MGYLIDSNVISDYFSTAFSIKAMDFLAEVINEIPNISVITKIEALSWRISNIEKEKIVRAFVNLSNVIALSDSVTDKCIDIRRNFKMKTPDSIIAATAIVYHFTLITSDADFNRIPDLNRINPFNL
jgi:predicted nucleic acid-binding protein